MIKIGITGGIGSGKTTVCRVFGILGIPVFSADVEAKRLMNTDPLIRKKLIHLFGSEVYLPNRSINREYLAGIVFENTNLLAQLNSVVHPAVRKKFENWFAMQSSPYILHEAAILFESGFYRLMDLTITVSTREKERVQRVMKRDGSTEEQVIQRIRNQWTDEQRNKMADFVICNNDDELIIPQIVEIHKKIRQHG